nr:transporter substrate-binding domain-containing protein [Niveibacterium umoris]
MRQALLAFSAAVALFGQGVVRADGGCRQAYELPFPLYGEVLVREADGRLSGYAYDLVAELARRSQCSLSVTDVPAARLQAMRKQGEIALLPFSAERAPAPGYRFIATDSVVHDMLVNVQRAPQPLTVDAVIADKRLVFGRVRGIQYGAEIDALFNQLGPTRVDESSSIDDLLRKLAAGRIDAALQSPLAYHRKLNALKSMARIEVLEYAGAPPQVVGWTLLSPPLDPQDAQLLGRSIQGMYEDGTTTKILARYIGEAKAKRARLPRRARESAP